MRQKCFVLQFRASSVSAKWQAKMVKSHMKEKDSRKHRYVRFCLNTGTAQSVMLFTACTQSLLRELSVAVRNTSQKAVEKLSCSSASYCSGSVTSKVTNSPVKTPWAQPGLTSARVHQATAHPCVCSYKHQGLGRRRKVICKLIQNIFSQ